MKSTSHFQTLEPTLLTNKSLPRRNAGFQETKKTYDISISYTTVKMFLLYLQQLYFFLFPKVHSVVTTLQNV